MKKWRSLIGAALVISLLVFCGSFNYAYASTLAETLNSGHQAAATAAGVNSDSILSRKQENGGISGSCEVTTVDVSESDEILTSVFFASDAQFYQSNTQSGYGDTSIWFCTDVIDSLVKLAKENGHEIETFVFGGDYTQNEGSRKAHDPNYVELFGENLQWHYGNNPKYSIADFKETIKSYYDVSDDNILFAQGNHEPDITEDNDFGLAKSGAHEFDDYIVYIINDQDLPGRGRVGTTGNNIAIIDGKPSITPIDNPKAVAENTANTLNAYLNGLVAAGDTRPVFIASHQALYSERLDDYNGYAKLITDAINEPAKSLDIIFFFGHTHKKVDNIGGGLSYVAKGEVLPVANDPNLSTEPTKDDYDYTKLNFTYMNFGHLARYDGSVNRDILSSTVVDIAKNKLVLTRYRARKTYASEDEKILQTHTIITGVFDGNGETITLNDGNTLTVSNNGVLKNATVDATNGKVSLNGLILNGVITFDKNGKISTPRGETAKIVDGTTNTFLIRDSFAGTPDKYYVKIKNNTTNKTDNVLFSFDPIYTGEIMFRLNITNVPTDADLAVVFNN